MEVLRFFHLVLEMVRRGEALASAQALHRYVGAAGNGRSEARICLESQTLVCSLQQKCEAVGMRQGSYS
jgi:hypothetical protein